MPKVHHQASLILFRISTVSNWNPGPEIENAIESVTISDDGYAILIELDEQAIRESSYFEGDDTELYVEYIQPSSNGLSSESGILLDTISDTFRFGDGIPEAEYAYVDLEDSEPYVSVSFDEEFGELTEEETNSLLDYFKFTVDGSEIDKNIFTSVVTASNSDSSGGDSSGYDRNDWIDFYFDPSLLSNEFDIFESINEISIEYNGNGPLKG